MGRPPKRDLYAWIEPIVRAVRDDKKLICLCEEAGIPLGSRGYEKIRRWLDGKVEEDGSRTFPALPEEIGKKLAAYLDVKPPVWRMYEDGDDELIVNGQLFWKVDDQGTLLVGKEKPEVLIPWPRVADEMWKRNPG